MRVLILGPWPVARPRHGGQIRAASIIEAYRARGHEVRFMGIYDPGNVPLSDTDPDDVAVDGDVGAYVAAATDPPGWSFWAAFAEVPALFQRFEAVVRQFRPDIVQFEEPYLWLVVQKLRARGCIDRARIIHSSYNYETALRRDLMEIDGNVDEQVLARVAAQEEDIAREADLVVTVSDDDAECFRRIGANNVLVARNGSRRPEATTEALAALDGYLGTAPFVLFVSSAHTPNARGLLDMVEGVSIRLPGPLVIAGSVSRLLAPQRARHRLLRDARMVGVVEPSILDALVVRAGVIILPKTRGGGSNLKTSEALLARRPIVATDLAFVGFEDWRDLPGVHIANEPAAFWERVTQKLTQAESIGSSDGPDPRDALLWSSCLAPMTDAVEALALEDRTARDERESLDSNMAQRAELVMR